MRKLMIVSMVLVILIWIIAPRFLEWMGRATLIHEGNMTAIHFAGEAVPLALTIVRPHLEKEQWEALMARFRAIEPTQGTEHWSPATEYADLMNEILAMAFPPESTPLSREELEEMRRREGPRNIVLWLRNNLVALNEFCDGLFWRNAVRNLTPEEVEKERQRLHELRLGTIGIMAEAQRFVLEPAIQTPPR